MEQIYTFIAEWQKYASSQVSLKVQFDVLTNLIVSWRKLELSTWKSLFEFEEKSVEKNIGKWWFYLLEIIIIPMLGDNEKEPAVTLLSALNVFMSKVTCGEFTIRLKLLKAFKIMLLKSIKPIQLLMPCVILLHFMNSSTNGFIYY